jgi:hypothetical protein
VEQRFVKTTGLMAGRTRRTCFLYRGRSVNYLNRPRASYIMNGMAKQRYYTRTNLASRLGK